MPNYYYKDAAGQEQGPFSIEELLKLNISADTPVRDEFQTEWKTAEQVAELKNNWATSTTNSDAVVTEPVISKTITAAATPTVAKVTGVKSTAWLSYLLSLLVLGGVGYFIYQDIEKNKGNSNAIETLNMTTSSTDSADAEPVTTSDANNSDTAVSTVIGADTTSTVVSPATTDPTTATNTKDKQQLLAKQKAEDEKKKQQLLAKQKAEDEKKKLLAAQALAAKQLQMRNNWSKYISLGSLNYQPKGDDGMTAFDVPVINGTDVTLNKVTVRIDYYKKEKKDKIVSTETITIYNVPPKSGLNGKAPENKKAKKAVATITSITSRQLNFCYPQGSGKSGDAYYCN